MGKLFDVDKIQTTRCNDADVKVSKKQATLRRHELRCNQVF